MLNTSKEKTSQIESFPFVGSELVSFVAMFQRRLRKVFPPKKMRNKELGGTSERSVKSLPRGLSGFETKTFSKTCF